MWGQTLRMTFFYAPSYVDSPQAFRWLYIDFNSYFASVEQQLNPALRCKPVAVVPLETDSTCAIAASYEAKAFGIKTGTPVYEAKRLCPGLICVPAKHEHYVEYHQRILEEIDRHVPVTMVCSIDEVAVRLMNNENSVEQATAIAKSIKAGLAKNVGEYIRCSIGIAPNRYLAKVATDLQKPDGLTFLHGKDLPGRLMGLKLRDLPGIGHNMERRLSAAGIWTMDALWALDRKQMRKVWGGILGERLWYSLRGVELPDEETNRSTVGHSHVLAPELRDPDKAVYVARRLLLKAASRLRRLDYYAKTISLSVRLEKGGRLQYAVRTYRAQDSITFIHAFDTMWKQLDKDSNGERIRKVSVSLNELVAADALSADLFDEIDGVSTKQRSKWESLSRALDKLNHRYGRDTVSLGILPSQGRSFSGTKVAFTRIPDVEEFLE